MANSMWDFVRYVYNKGHVQKKLNKKKVFFKHENEKNI